MSVPHSGGPSNPCDDMCHALIGRNIVSWIIAHHIALFLAQNHLHTIWNQYLWNTLINSPMLIFIPQYAWFLCRSWWSNWVNIDRQQDPPHLALCSSRVKVRTMVYGISLITHPTQSYSIPCLYLWTWMCLPWCLELLKNGMTLTQVSSLPCCKTWGFLKNFA